MRFLILLFFASTFVHGQGTISTVNSSAKDNPSLEIFGKKLFECFKKQNRTTFKTLLASADQMEKGIEAQITDTAKKRVWLKRHSKDGPILFPQYNEMSLNSFDKIIETGKTESLDWSKIKYVDFKYRTKNSTVEFKDIQGRLEYTYKGKPYSIFVTTATYLVDNWYILIIKVNSYTDQK